MNNLVEIPVWVLVLGGILAAVGILDRLLMPSVRWFLRRRLNRIIDSLNDRLQLSIQPFKLTRRKTMIDRLSHDPKIMEAVDEQANTENIPRVVVAKMAERYAREIVPSFSASAYFGFAIRISKFLATAMYRVRLGFSDDEALKNIDPKSAVIFVINHRSNMDYLLVTYLVAERSALSYAVGEWAQVWPLKQLVRAMGGYFIRRKSRNRLYRKVLARYVQMATEGGVTQAIFLEGGLSRDGKLGEPKLGLLSYIIGDFNPDTSKNVVFVPVGLNYDRVLEDRVLTAAPVDGKNKFRFQPSAFVKYMTRQIWLRLTGKFYRNGYACVSFGQPISLGDYMNSHSRVEMSELIENLGGELMGRIGDVVPVLPVSLVSFVILKTDRAMNLLELKAKCHNTWQTLSARGVYSHIPHEDEDYAVEVGLRMLTLRDLVTEKDGKYSPATDQGNLVEFYANGIAHHFDNDDLVTLPSKQ